MEQSTADAWRELRRVSPRGGRIAKQPICKLEDCGTKHSALGYCEKHYIRFSKYGDPYMVKKADHRPKSNLNPELRLQRLLARIDRQPDGCWIWTGQKMLNGYGMMRYFKELRYVHRLSYELHVGPIPEGLHIDHLCRVRLCVNPDHLEPVLPAVNAERGFGACSLNSRKTHCIRGHEFSNANTYITKEGHRNCRQCIRVRRAEARASMAVQ